MVSPVEKYQSVLQQPEFQADPAQQAVITLFEDLYQRLLLGQQEQQGAFRRLFNRFTAAEPELQKGLYLWGGVGRGKTMLMDLFYECLPEQLRLRMHFHRFMQRVHRELTVLSGTPNPLLKVADGFAAQASVLCFDEFFVSDIGDAMILAELLKALFERGVTLVATSNVEPRNLYENGLQRSRFLPAIDLLERHTHIHHVRGDIDYRLRLLEQAEIYHYPLDGEAEQSLRKSFAALAPEPPQIDLSLTIESREIRCRAIAEDVAWFDFVELCEGPRSQNDYIELAKIFHAIVLGDVPQFTTTNEDAARRFISLVDELYDRGVKLILSAASPIAELYQGRRLEFEFNRTESRLIEMQSHEYLARSHKA